MKNQLIVILFLFCLCCKGQGERESTFEEEAKIFFQDNRRHLDLQELNAEQECILFEIITKELPTSRKVAVANMENRLLLKNYFSAYLELRFGLLKDKSSNNFHLITLPELDKFIYRPSEYYQSKNDSVNILRSDMSLISLNTDSFNSFFEGEGKAILSGCSLSSKVQLCKTILSQVAFVNLHEISIEQMEEQLELLVNSRTLDTDSHEKIRALLHPYKKRREFLQIGYFVDAGFSLCFYQHNEYSDVSIKMYFLPLKERHKTVKAVDTQMYQNCIGTR